MPGNFKPSHYETPEERLKRMILERLDGAALADAAGKKKEYCILIKHFLLTLKGDMPSKVIDAIETRDAALKTKIEGIDKNDKLSMQEREKQMVEAEYEVRSLDLVDGIDSMRNSKIMQRQMAGIILTGKTMKDLNDVGKRIRESDAVETVIEEQEGMEDGGEVE